MDVDDFYLVVVLEVLAQLGDIDVHGACVEVVVVDPDGLQCKVALEYLVGVAAKEGEQLVFLCGELCLLVADGEELLLCVERESSEAVSRALFVFLSSYAAEDGFNTEHEFFHREWFGDIVVGTDLETVEDVFLEGLGGKEDDRNLALACLIASFLAFSAALAAALSSGD